MSARDSARTDHLEKHSAIKTTSQASAEARTDLDELLSRKVGEYTSPDASLVVFGSLARDEWTAGSDLDWTYLIDGQAAPEHLFIAQNIESAVALDERFKQPGPTGTFGNMVFSHDLVHQIGGQNDTNRNMTQRVLLLLESAAIGKRPDAYERVLRAVINRYLEEDNHLLTPDGKSYRVPRFLLNDFVRFWRTMGVDFASKQRDRGGKGWGLRNAKLRMSRKLIFASGLLLCFGCQLDKELQSRMSTPNSDIKLTLVSHISECVRLTPLQVLARAVEKYKVPDSIAETLFSSYSEFLSMLNGPERGRLTKVRAEDSRSDPLFAQVRAISEKFEHALAHLFFDIPDIRELTRKYGVF